MRYQSIARAQDSNTSGSLLPVIRTFAIFESVNSDPEIVTAAFAVTLGETTTLVRRGQRAKPRDRGGVDISGEQAVSVGS